MNIQKNLVRTFNDLSQRRRAVALEFLEYLRGKEDDVTADILADKKVLTDVRVARHDWQRGARKAFTSWGKIRRHV